MFPSGLAAFEKRNEQKSAIYSYENRPEKLTNEYELVFKQFAFQWSIRVSNLGKNQIHFARQFRRIRQF